MIKHINTIRPYKTLCGFDNPIGITAGEINGRYNSVSIVNYENKPLMEMSPDWEPNCEACILIYNLKQ